MNYQNRNIENIIKEEINKAFKKILKESVTREELERLFPDDVKIRITQELAEQMLDYAINNIVEDFFHLERPQIYVTKISSIGAFSFERPITYNRYTREMKNGYGSNATEADLYALCPMIRLNNSVKASKKSWFNTVCHELCHMLSIFRTCTNPVRAHGKEFKYEAAEFYNTTYGYVNVTTYAKDEEIEYSQEEQDKTAQKELNESKKLKYYIQFLEDNDELRLFRLANDKEIQAYMKWSKTQYFIQKFGEEKCKWYHIINEELSKKLYNAGYKSTSKTLRHWAIKNDKPELRNEIISHINDSNYMEEVHSTPQYQESQINEIDNLSSNGINDDEIVTIPANTPLSGEFM